MMTYQEKIEAVYKIAEKSEEEGICEALSDGEFLGKQKERWVNYTPQEIFEEILLET